MANREPSRTAAVTVERSEPEPSSRCQKSEINGAHGSRQVASGRVGAKEPPQLSEGLSSCPGAHVGAVGDGKKTVSYKSTVVRRPARTGP